MSEHQYYGFVAVDRPLTAAERSELRDISSRAEISATRFTNTYNYGDFRGDPAALMARFFDLHLYLANWGTRRLMVRLPRDAVDEAVYAAALENCEGTTLTRTGDHLVIDIERQSDDADEEARQRARAEEERKRRARIVALASRGEWAWREVETEIERRHASGYDRAASLLADLRGLAERDGALPAYDRRVADIRARHATKRTLIQRLDRIDPSPGRR